MKKTNKNQTETLYEFGEMLTQYKKKYKVSFIILTQLNREIERPERLNNPMMHTPRKADVTHSDGLYQHADLVCLLMFPDKLHLPSYTEKEYPSELIYLHIDKARFGESEVLVFKNNFALNSLDEIDFKHYLATHQRNPESENQTIIDF